ncbi:MAG: hypothetical protein U9N34_00950 [Candidatus Cloacimonadota bacterium]|nr:hypothetical protein [Candidatus Cloacimonadota bacterium]
MPGTIIKISSAPLTCYDDFMENFVLHNGVSVAKYFWVDGRIIADGTED